MTLRSSGPIDARRAYFLVPYHNVPVGAVSGGKRQSAFKKAGAAEFPVSSCFLAPLQLLSEHQSSLIELQ